MSKVCEVCGKGVVVGMNVSHSHIRNKRTWEPNLQKVKAIVDGSPKRIRVCTTCLKSGKVQRAI
ncbi:MAG: 50S ribosomal protein L28 [Eubacteriales bacterium]|nr:50S ribosomal protein L28 [Bacillota bacterium]MBV1726631.1 50S ribosomal protein L28 [Desulforudis sp.]MDP3050302.1 50S ribosomal protein L28 [Eubacteriales bacterium]MBV1736065.1 50S ribosomal protein L28 [Desulforudis sp.]MDZ4042829.1 50S ribosomal protein L28 [Eubacteriales bacterium]